jgi:hypothetical protein
MPKISEFLGIAIYMYFTDHQPPHFHAFFGGQEVLIDIRTMTVHKGKFPRPQLNLVLTWGLLYQAALMAAWELALRGKTPGKIPPLVVGKAKRAKKAKKGKKK